MEQSRRKGSLLLDTVSILLLVTVISATAIILLHVVGEMEVASSFLNTTYWDDAKAALGLVDYGVIFLVAGFYMASLISALLIPTNPVFLIPAIITMGIGTWLSTIFSNLFWTIARVGVIRDAVNQFPAIITMFENLPWIIGGLMALMVIITFFNPGGTSGEVTV